jgi:hypothetical protein
MLIELKNFLEVLMNIILESAETKNSDGMFNLGSMYMLPSTLGRERDLKKGINLI